MLLEAAKRLIAEGLSDLRILFVGDPHSDAFRRALEAQIARAGVATSSAIVGHCDDMPAAYLAAAVIVAPATEPEAFGRVAIEAQAMGAPVIISDIGAAPEIVLAPPQTPRHQATGWRVPPGDPVALAEAIAEALSMKASARDELTLRARRNVQARFSVEEMQRRTLAGLRAPARALIHHSAQFARLSSRRHVEARRGRIFDDEQRQTLCFSPTKGAIE